MIIKITTEPVLIFVKTNNLKNLTYNETNMPVISKTYIFDEYFWVVVWKYAIAIMHLEVVGELH